MLCTMLLAVGLLSSSGSAAASASRLRLDRFAEAQSAAVGGGGNATVAYLTAPGTVTVRAPGKQPRLYAAPVGCAPSEVSFRAVACSSVVINLVDGDLTPLGIPGAVFDALGDNWALVDQYVSTDENPHTVILRLLFNWRTGRTISVGRDDRYGPRRYIDLDQAHPGRALCSPVRRVRSRDGSDSRYAPVTKIGAWTLTADPGNDAVLQRCGRHATKHFSFKTQPVLGTDFIGYLSARTIVYLDLRTGMRRSTPWPDASKPTLAAAGRRLIVSTTTTTGSHVLYQSVG
jgi:hypothetical protein